MHIGHGTHRTGDDDDGFTTINFPEIQPVIATQANTKQSVSMEESKQYTVHNRYTRYITIGAPQLTSCGTPSRDHRRQNSTRNITILHKTSTPAVYTWYSCIYNVERQMMRPRRMFFLKVISPVSYGNLRNIAQSRLFPMQFDFELQLRIFFIPT